MPIIRLFTAFKKFLKPDRTLPLFLGFLLLIFSISSAATPNPGHPWTEVGDGLIQFSVPTALRTYTLPDQNTTLLTSLPFSQGDLLYGTGASTTGTLAKDTNATRYLSNTGASNNPAWSLINLTNGVSDILASTSGGTGNASTSFTGMTLGRTYTLPDANATLLTSNTPVTLAQGGTGASLVANNGGVVYSGASALALTGTTSLSSAPFPSSLIWSDMRLELAPSSMSRYSALTFYMATSTGFSLVIGTSSDPVIDRTSRTMRLYVNSGATTISNLGFPAAPTTSGTLTSVVDNNAPWINHATTNTNGNSAGMISPIFDYVFPRNDELSFSAYIKTDASATTTSGYWIGMFKSNPDNNPTPTASTVYAFRYYSSVDTTPFWRVVVCEGGFCTTVATTTFEIRPNTTYQMNILCGTSSECHYAINGSFVATSTVFVNSSIGYGIRITNLGASARNVKWSRLSISTK